ncbi:MAG TPA: hypothetical protein PKC98_22145 [Candidatus Melainabacteria bacterium]|nr:hypothetical protein [Candidatus Melainabacteria bacterium]
MTKVNHSLISLAALITLLLPAAASAKSAEIPHVEKVVTKAPPKVVYDTNLKFRKTYPQNVKELSRTDKHCVVEETFNVLPVIGKAKCIYKETYVPDKEVTYEMVESQRFKAFEGKWTITPANGGKHTNLSLSSYIDPGINLPFAKQITKMETKKGIKKRLAAVKHNSEKQQVALGDGGGTQ